jgi:hypothetical protein
MLWGFGFRSDAEARERLRAIQVGDEPRYLAVADMEHGRPLRYLLKL